MVFRVAVAGEVSTSTDKTKDEGHTVEADTALSSSAEDDTSASEPNKEENAEDGTVSPLGAATQESDKKSGLPEKSINRDFVDQPSDANETNRATEKRQRAKEYFMRGELLFDGGDYAKAAAAFTLAYELVPHQAVLGNIALCYDKAGKWPDAVTYYRSYLLDPVESEENDSIRKRLQELEKLIGEISVACDAKACHIRVNGILRGPAPANVVVLPGENRIEAILDGEVMESALIEVAAREFLEVRMKGKAKSGPPVITKRKTQVVENKDTTFTGKMGPGFWVAAGGTFVGASLLATFGGLTLSYHNQYDVEDKKEGKDRDDDKVEDLRAEGKKYRLVTNVMIGVTSVAAVATIVLGVLDAKKRKKKKKIAIAPGLGVSLGGSF